MRLKFSLLEYARELHCSEGRALAARQAERALKTRALCDKEDESSQQLLQQRFNTAHSGRFGCLGWLHAVRDVTDDDE
jgi:hypothetical protein